MSDLPGYESVLHRSLTERILFGGVPRTLAIALWTPAAALGLGLHAYWLLAVAFVLHMGAAYLTRRDPYFFELLRETLRLQRRLEP